MYGLINWWKSGKLPVDAEQMPTGTIIVKENKDRKDGVALYARLSSHDQKKDLYAQLGRLSVFAVSKGLSDNKAVTEKGSGLNGHRPQLKKLLGGSTAFPHPNSIDNYDIMSPGKLFSSIILQISLINLLKNDFSLPPRRHSSESCNKGFSCFF